MNCNFEELDLIDISSVKNGICTMRVYVGIHSFPIVHCSWSYMYKSRNLSRNIEKHMKLYSLLGFSELFPPEDTHTGIDC